MSNEIIGWVLPGGGAKGAFQVGVMKKLIGLGIVPHNIYGTSVGSLNAVGYAFSRSPAGGMDQLEKFWLDIEDQGDILSKNTFGLISLTADGVYSTKPLQEKLDVLIKGQPICNVLVSFVNLKTKDVYYSSPADPRFKDHVLASASIPFAMDPVEGVLFDGGVRDNVPLKRAIADGCDTIYVIHTNPLDRNVDDGWTPPKWPAPFVKYGLRAIELLEDEIFRNDLEKCKARNKLGQFKKIDLKVYAPEKLYCDTLEFDPKKIRLAIKAGLEAKERA